METVLLKVKIPGKFFTRYLESKGIYAETLDETIRGATQHKLKGLHPGIKVELFGTPKDIAQEVSAHAEAICKGIKDRQEREA